MLVKWAVLTNLFSIKDGQSTEVPAFEVQSKCFDRFQRRLDDIMRDVIRFAKRIPGFSELVPEDKIVIVQSGCFEVRITLFIKQSTFLL